MDKNKYPTKSNLTNSNHIDKSRHIHIIYANQIPAGNAPDHHYILIHHYSYAHKL